MPFTDLFFDLDDTLYSPRNGLWFDIRERMGRYMVERLGLPVEQVPEIRRFYYETYGTTLRGLQRHYQVDCDDYLDFVHDLPLEDYIQPNPALRDLLTPLTQRCWIFTNADINHACRVLNILGVKDCFKGIIDVKAIQFACKPEKIAYQRALEIAGHPEPAECIILDDSQVNLEAAYQLGFTTILVNPNGDQRAGVMYAIPDILSFEVLAPDLLAGKFSSGS